MSSEDAALGTGILFATFVWAILLCGISSCQHGQWQADAIKHGAAEYDQQTGEWRWKVKPEQE